MQPISNVPLYANCFDQLTTNGIIAEDLMGYVTGTPSPYLQNYVAQRGGVPNLPGQILPDTLTPAISGNTNVAQAQHKTLPQGDIYNVAPKNITPETLEPPKKGKIDTAKKIAAGILLIGLTALGIVKGKTIYKNAKTFFQNTFSNSSNFSFQTPAWIKSAKQTIINGFNQVCSFGKNSFNKLKTKIPVWTQKAKQGIITGFNKVCNFFKDLWNKIFHKTTP